MEKKLFIRIENIKDSDLSWVETKHDTYLVHENPKVLKGLLEKWQFLELPLIVQVNEYGKGIDWNDKNAKNVHYQLFRNYLPSSLIKSIRPAKKKELS